MYICSHTHTWTKNSCTHRHMCTYTLVCITTSTDINTHMYINICMSYICACVCYMHEPRVDATRAPRESVQYIYLGVSRLVSRDALSAKHALEHSFVEEGRSPIIAEASREGGLNVCPLYDGSYLPFLQTCITSLAQFRILLQCSHDLLMS